LLFLVFLESGAGNTVEHLVSLMTKTLQIQQQQKTLQIHQQQTLQAIEAKLDTSIFSPTPASRYQHWFEHHKKCVEKFTASADDLASILSQNVARTASSIKVEDALVNLVAPFLAAAAGMHGFSNKYLGISCIKYCCRISQEPSMSL